MGSSPVGDLAGALATARSIPHDRQRAWAIGNIAGSRAKAGDIAKAFATARGIPDDVVRAIALVIIAEAQVEVARQR